MNKRKRKHLMEKMIGILLLGFFLALLLFLLIFFMGNGALNRYFESSMYRRNVSKETIAMFQEYVSRHHLAASDTERIREWAKENHIGYFTISRKRMLLYDNYYTLPVALDRTKSEQLHYTWQYFQEVSFTDGNADVFIYVNRERKYYILVDVAAALCGVLVWIGVFAFGVSGYVRYIRQLSGEVAKLEDGLWSVGFTIKGEDELTDLARGLEHMKTVLLEKEEKERNMKKAQNKLVLGMAHDLRTPLTAIYGYLNLLKKEECPEHIKRYLDAIENRAQALKQLTEELFRYTIVISEAEEMTLQVLPLNGILESSISAYYSVLKQNHIVPEISIPDQQITGRVNENALSRVLGNILSNAVKYSDGDLKIVLSEDGDIRISNHASGLSEVQAERLFDRFYTVNTARKSTGLGLSIAKALMEKMGGTITADYRENVLEICVSVQKL